MSYKKNILLGLIWELPASLYKDNKEASTTSTLHSILKLLQLLEKFKSIKLNLYLNPTLLKHLDTKNSNLISQLRILLDEKKIELLTGGIYDPIFPLIPKEDRQNQILASNRIINHLLGINPSGLWLTKSAWDTHMPIDIFKPKLDYVFLDKEIFLNSNTNLNKPDGFYITEEDGKKNAVFFIDEYINLNDFTPNRTEKIFENDKSLEIVFFNLKTFADENLESFNDFLNILESKSFTTHLANDYFHSHNSNGLIYLTNQFTTQNFKNSLAQSYELNLLHKKMLRVSKKINFAKEGKSRFKVIKEMIGQSQDFLFKGQALFSFIYNSQNLDHELKETAYSHIIKSENLIDISSMQGSKWVHSSETDFDTDGHDEIILETETQNLYISPFYGGSIIEHDFRPLNKNLFTAFKYNGNLKFNFMDFFYKDSKEFNPDFSNRSPLHPYKIEKIKTKEDTCKVTLASKLLSDISDVSLEVKKEYLLKSTETSLNINYEIINPSKNKIVGLFGFQVNLLLNNVRLDDINPLKDSLDFSIFSAQNNLEVNFSYNIPCTIHRKPLKDNEGKVFGISFFPIWEINLNPEEKLDLSIKQNINVNPN